MHCVQAFALARKLAGSGANFDVTLYAELKKKAQDVVAPAVAYFDKVFHDELKEQLAVIKACQCRLIDPVQAEQQQPTILDLNGVSHLPIMTQHPELLAGVKAQLPQYLAEVQGMSRVLVNDIYEWWRSVHATGHIPAWVELTRYVLVLRPHAAGPERIFSRVIKTFHHTQSGTLEDEIETAMMTQVNTKHFPL